MSEMERSMRELTAMIRRLRDSGSELKPEERVSLRKADMLLYSLGF